MKSHALDSFVLIRVEPGMGFVTPADYFGPVKVTAGYASVPWLVVNLFHPTFPVAVLRWRRFDLLGGSAGR